MPSNDMPSIWPWHWLPSASGTAVNTFLTAGGAGKNGSVLHTPQEAADRAKSTRFLARPRKDAPTEPARRSRRCRQRVSRRRLGFRHITEQLRRFCRPRHGSTNGDMIPPFAGDTRGLGGGDSCTHFSPFPRHYFGKEDT